jgi:hypothetical protein
MCGHSPKAMGQNRIRVLDGIGCNADIVSSLHSCHVAAEPSARHLGFGSSRFVAMRKMVMINWSFRNRREARFDT